MSVHGIAAYPHRHNVHCFTFCVDARIDIPRLYFRWLSKFQSGHCIWIASNCLEAVFTVRLRVPLSSWNFALCYPEQKHMHASSRMRHIKLPPAKARMPEEQCEWY